MRSLFMARRVLHSRDTARFGLDGGPAIPTSVIRESFESLQTNVEIVFQNLAHQHLPGFSIFVCLKSG
jgi:hypothetical protein